jgi:hypothetical protein
MPKYIAKFTVTISNANGDCPDPKPEQYDEWHESGGGVVGNVRALHAYDYEVLLNGRIGVEDDVYLNGTGSWRNKQNALMGMSRECFEKYFVPVS